MQGRPGQKGVNKRVHAGSDAPSPHVHQQRAQQSIASLHAFRAGELLACTAQLITESSGSEMAAVGARAKAAMTQHGW